MNDTDPEKMEKKSRGWPVSVRCDTFVEADEVEAKLKANGRETVRFAMGGQFLIVRAR